MREKLIGGAHADNRFVRMLGIHSTDSTGECGDGRWLLVRFAPDLD
jgi:hypothetical protein